jgi:hypothetical protein
VAALHRKESRLDEHCAENRQQRESFGLPSQTKMMCAPTQIRWVGLIEQFSYGEATFQVCL